MKNILRAIRTMKIGVLKVRYQGEVSDLEDLCCLHPRQSSESEAFVILSYHHHYHLNINMIINNAVARMISKHP